MAAERVMVEGAGNSEIIGSMLGPGVLSFCPHISLYSLEMANKTRLQYWKLDEPTVKKNMNSPLLSPCDPCLSFFLVFRLSVTSPAHTCYPKCQVLIVRHHGGDRENRLRKSDLF